MICFDHESLKYTPAYIILIMIIFDRDHHNNSEPDVQPYN
jgi:hypothetical protein